MSNNLPSAPPIDNQSFYDIELDYSQDNNDFSIDSNLLRENSDDIQQLCNKTLIFNRVIYSLLL